MTWNNLCIFISTVNYRLHRTNIPLYTALLQKILLEEAVAIRFNIVDFSKPKLAFNEADFTH